MKSNAYRAARNGAIGQGSASFGDNANAVSVPGHTLVDAALRYKKNGWQAALNVSNLFDKTYYSTCFPGSGCIYGEGRVVKGSLSMKF
ncbi:TonB-dependent receptor [Mesorhizobium tianshanense]|uniref:Iron complex outermembrane receptor protein n=1 Tax=Mesorhizobium tianshanense TaxID=39844 RepID=A0A562P8L4_9HYPH|nr:TonB-dependent receptor [Mesorhizobium tianshanense]TWI40336.1 iron complex outermembrane receptor protein [Mesorhizobium tianshanense]